MTPLRRLIRPLASAPGFTVAAILTLALGIGAGTALFSVVRAVLLRPFPFAEQDRLVVVLQHDLRRDHPWEISFPAYRDWRDNNDVFEGLAAMPNTNMGTTLTGHGDPTQIQMRPVTGNFFDVLGVRPLMGRVLNGADEAAGAAPEAVISHGLWQRLFGGERDVLGRTLTLDGLPHEVVGVMPREFTYPEGAELWTPLVRAVPARFIHLRQAGWLRTIGRLAPGVTADQARDAMLAITEEAGRRYPDEAERGVIVRPVAADILGDTRLALLLLAGGVGLVLLIACANVANLLLARAAAREREMATRLALGATRVRLVAQMLAESLPLAAAGAAGGVALAWLAIELLQITQAAGLPRAEAVALDLPVLAFAAALAIVTVVLSSLVPALRASRGASLAVTSGARAGDTRGAARLRDLLVAGEVALALVVSVGAALLGRTFIELQRADLGFDPSGVLTAEIGLGSARAAEPASAHAALDEIRARMAASPGVESAAFVFLRPLWGPVGFDWPFLAEGQTKDEADHNPFTTFESATPGYFATMGIRLIEGRDFTAADDARAPGAVVVSERLARRIWPGQRAIGRRIKGPGLGPYSYQWLTVVGVVEDARYREVESTHFDVYMAHEQSPMPLRHLVVKTSLTRPEDLTPTVRAAVRAVDPGAFVDDARSMQAIVDDALAGRRLRARLFLGLALLAVGLAIGGVYGVMSYSVAERRRELAVRVALGAGRRSLFTLVFGRGARVAAAGIAAGLAGAYGLSHLAQALLVGISARDPLMFAAAGALTAAAALAAGYVPARRASRADPADALRV